DAGVGCIVLAALSVLAALLGPGWRRSHAGICTSARKHRRLSLAYSRASGCPVPLWTGLSPSAAPRQPPSAVGPAIPCGTDGSNGGGAGGLSPRPCARV